MNRECDNKVFVETETFVKIISRQVFTAHERITCDLLSALGPDNSLTVLSLIPGQRDDIEQGSTCRCRQLLLCAPRAAAPTARQIRAQVRLLRLL